MIRFSIILPVFNGGDYLKSCVCSILAQTYTNFNLLVLENFSSDGTREWLEALTDERIRVFASNQKLSIEENWARIVGIQKNEFMTIIGHDDLLEPFYLEEMHALIQLQPDASLYQSHFKYIDRNGTFIRYSRLLPATVTSVDLLKLLLTRGIDTMGTGYMMRSEDYDRLGGISYHYPKLLFADHELWLKLSDINKMAVCDKSCFSYRLHDNTSALADPVSYQDAFFHFLDFLHLYISKDLKFKQELDADIDSYIIYFAESLAHRLLRFPMRDRNNIRVADFFSKCKRVSRLFHFDGREVEFIKFESILPLLIDSNSITRRLFLLWKLTFPRPLFK